MKKEVSEEKLDQLIKSIIADTRLGQDELDEIADSPKLRWAVQRSIANQTPSKLRGWIPTFDWRIVAFASLVFVWIAGLALINRYERSAILATAANGKSLELNFARPTEPVKPDQTDASTLDVPNPKVAARKVSTERVRTKMTRSARPESGRTSDQTTEIKSEFIALMYSAEPDAGQIVKVKVPRSMMVSLGVSTDVSDPTGLVNAEVLMGDDGSARAIRFVR